MVTRTRQALLLTALVITFVYLGYRAVFTFNVTTPYAIAASSALFIAELFTGILMLLYLLQVWRPSEPEQQPVLPNRTVDVFVPTYNEDVQILRNTLRACIAMDYEHRTFVLDDGRRPDVEALARELGVGYITRPDNKHAKAGNMNNALKQTDGEFVVILDADHVPDVNFITRLLGYFTDELMAYVQTPHAFYNFDSFQARYNPRKQTYWDEGQLFYDVIQPGRNRWNAAIFAGSAAIFRRQALEQIGGFAVETITEDLHTGMRIHSRGWKSLAISERLIAGQAAPDVTTFHSQRLRWGEGNLSIMAYDNPIWMPGLTLAQRLCYLGSMIHWAGGPFLLLIYATPVLALLTGVPPVNEFSWTFLTLIVLYLTFSYVSFKASSGRLGSYWNSQLFSMTNAWTSTRSVFRAMFRRRFQRFVVTSKRGRQSKSVLPFIWPQALLFLISVVALCWAWYLPISGISDDFYKPIIASMWVVFQMAVAAAVIYRSLWAESRRFSYRHVVSLPVVIEKDGVIGHGVCVDLHDAGIGVMAFTPVEPGDRLRISVRGPHGNVDCAAEVRWRQEVDSRIRARTRGLRAFRCGMRFLDLAPAQVDDLNEICWHFAVPRRYWQFGEKQRPEPRRLPVVLQMGEWKAESVTDEVTREGFSVLLNEKVADGTLANFVMATPGEEIKGTARLVDEQAQELAAHPYRRCRFQVESLEGHGRETLDALVNPSLRNKLRPLLAAYAPTRRVPVGQALLAAAVLLVCLLPVEYVLFRRYFREDDFLHSMALASAPLSEAEQQRLMDIYSHTVHNQRYPSNDRLVLLETALLHHRLLSEARSVTLILAKRDTSNLNLQLAYAQALDDTGESETALNEYQGLLQRVEAAKFPANRLAEARLAAARTAVHAGDLSQAEALFRTVLSDPEFDTNSVRDELAGVFLSADRPKDCVRLFEGRTPDFEGRTLLTRAYLHAGQYSLAEKDARELVRARPGDLLSQLLLLRALVLQGMFPEGAVLVNQLFEEYPDSHAVRIEMGQLALFYKRFEKAFLVFQGLLEGKRPIEKDEIDKVLRGYIDAAASVEDVSVIKPAIALRVDEMLSGRPGEQTDYVARMAWVLERIEEPNRAAALLRRLLASNPASAEYRGRYVHNLVLAGHWKEAQDFLSSLPQSPEVRRMTVEMYLAQKDFDAAEKVCQEVLRINPISAGGSLLLAQVMLARKDFKQARQLLEQVRQLRVVTPANRAMLAAYLQWAGDGAAALEEYRKLLDANFEQPDLWPGYLSAAAAAPELTTADEHMILSIAEKEIGASSDAMLLARLGWDLHRLKKTDLSQQALARALTLKPAAPAAHRELAGILGGVGMYAEAIAQYRGLQLDSDDQAKLASLYEATNDFQGAAKQYRILLKEKPTDLAVRERLSQVLIWTKDYPAAIVELKQLVQAKPDKTAWKIQLAQIQLWSGDNPAALATYTELLDAKADQPELWSGFVDAAGTAPKLSQTQASVAKAIGQLVVASPPDKPVFLSRLAWMLVRVGDSAQARILVDRAAALKPQEPEVRKEIAGVLGSVGQYRQAIQLLAGLNLSFDDRLNRVHLYNGERDFVASEAECRALLKLKPGDPKLELLLADILSWTGKYDEAAALLRQIARTNPAAPDLTLRQARVDLWGHNYDAALRQFADLLEKDRENKELANGFVEAASGSTDPLSDRYRVLLQEVINRALKNPPSDPLYLGRLADGLRRLREPAKAVVLLERAISLDPASRPLRLQLAEALYAVGRYEDAEKNFRWVLATANPSIR